MYKELFRVFQRNFYFTDIKEQFSDIIIRINSNILQGNESENLPEAWKSKFITKIFKQYFCETFENGLYEFEKFEDEINSNSVELVSSVEVSGVSILAFENPSIKLSINHVNNIRHKGVVEELNNVANQSKLRFALKPYKHYLNLPEIKHYRLKGQLETDKTTITIRNCSLILAFGLKKLIDDLNSNKIVPGFKWTNIEDYQTLRPKIELLSWRNVKRKQEYERYKAKSPNLKKGIWRLYNSTIFLKYNAIRYFYHVNSTYRDSVLNNGEIIEGTDLNIIYTEQIDDGIETFYSTKYTCGRKVHKIIHNTSMIDLCLNTISLKNTGTRYTK